MTARTRDYFSAKDAGHYDAAWNMLSAAQQARRPRPAWEAEARDFNAHAGTLRSRRLAPVRWLENPAGMTGVFGAVDYSGDFTGLVFACGIVIRQRQPDGAWLLFREQHQAAAREDAPNATPEQIAEIRRQVHCPD